jgi:hypothetical protein
MQKQVISGHLQAAGVGIFNGVLGGPAEGVWTCSAGVLQHTCRALLFWMGIKICDWWMSLLQHSCCKTHIFTKTFEATFHLTLELAWFQLQTSCSLGGGSNAMSRLTCLTHESACPPFG